MPRVAIDVLLKPEILDPQGRAVERALPGLGYEGVRRVRVGKHLELDVDAEGPELAARIDRMCAEFLTNPVIETYRWRVLDAAAPSAAAGVAPGGAGAVLGDASDGGAAGTDGAGSGRTPPAP